MSKLYLYYENYNHNNINILKIKIDNKITAEITRNTIYELELTNGQHNIKLYSEGLSSNDLIGYIDKNIEITDNTYFTYKKGKLIKNNFKNLDELKNHIAKKDKKYKTIKIIFIIILILIYIFF